MFRAIRERMPPFCLRYLTVLRFLASMPTFEKRLPFIFAVLPSDHDKGAKRIGNRVQVLKVNVPAQIS